MRLFEVQSILIASLLICYGHKSVLSTAEQTPHPHRTSNGLTQNSGANRSSQGQDGQGEELTSNLIRVFTLDESSAERENDVSQYSLDASKESTTIQFYKGSKCIQLNYGNKTVWKYDRSLSSEYPTEVFIQKSTRRIFVTCPSVELVFELCNGDWVLRDSSKGPSNLRRTGPVGTLEQQSKAQAARKTVQTPAGSSQAQSGDLSKEDSQLYVSHVRVFTANGSQGGSVAQDDHTQYVVEEHPKSFYYRFNPSARCTQLEYAGKTVWRYDDQKNNEYPKELFFQRSQKRITVNCPTLYLTYEYMDDQWVLKSRTDLKHVFATGLTIVTADDAQGANARENDTSKYTVTRHDFVVQYELKPDSICTEFKCKGMTVWKYDPKKAGRGTPKNIYFHTDFGAIFVDFENLSSIYRCTAKGCQFLANRPMDGLSEKQVSIFTEDPEKPSQMVENDPAAYKRKAMGYGYIYIMNDEVKCKELKYGNRCLWNYGYKSGKEYPTAIFVSFHLKMIVLKFSNFHLVYLHMDRWRYIGKSSTDSYSESDVTLVTKGEGNKLDENDKSKYDVVMYPYGYAMLFNLKNSAKCTQIRFRNKTVWTHDPKKFGENYPTTIYLNRDMKMMVVSAAKFFYVYIHIGKWREAFGSRDKNILEPDKTPSTEFTEAYSSSDSSDDSSGDEKDFQVATTTDSDSSTDSGSSTDSDSSLSTATTLADKRFALEDSASESEEEPERQKTRKRKTSRSARRPAAKTPQPSSEAFGPSYRAASLPETYNSQDEPDNGPESDPESIKRRQANPPREMTLDKTDKGTASKQKRSTPIAAIVSGVLALLVLMALVGGAIFYLRKRRRATTESMLQQEVDIV